MILNLFYFVNIVGFISLVLYLVLTKSNVTKSIFPIVLLVAFSSFVDIILIHHFRSDSEKWSKIYLFLEIVVLSRVFVANSEKFFRIVTVFFLLIFTLSAFFFTFFSTNFSAIKTDGFLSIIIFIYIILYSIHWFILTFKKIETASLLSLPLFYLITGLLLYNSGTLFLFLMREEIKNSSVSLYDYWLVNLILVLIFRILLIVTIWKGRTT